MLKSEKSVLTKFQSGFTKMRIGIDISQIVYQGTGTASYTQNLVKNLLRIDRKNEYVFFGSSLRQKKSIADFCESVDSGSKSNVFPLPPIFLELLWNKWHKIPVERFTGPLDIFHTSDWLEPPSRCPKVTTIHDLAILKYPETFMPKGKHDIVENQKRKLEWVKKEARLVIAVSENTKKDIVELLGIPAKKIRVIYEAPGEEFYPREKEEIENVRQKYQITGDYILAVGTREPRKNLERTIRAMSSLTGVTPVKGLPLVIVGKFGWGGEEKFKVQRSKFKVLGYVPQGDLPALYSGASCFVYPSLYEGFGLPVLEAMACGCPVVNSRVSSLPEIAGEAAVLVDPLEVDDIARGIKEAIGRREEMVKKGLKRVKLFSWEKCARETLEVYKEAVSM
jgi:glycosyltransferase involved in cell wall biosynthesis